MGARRRARPRGARERPRGSVLELVKLEPRRRSVQCASPKGLHRIAYLEWGDPRNRDVLVCVHGLTRSAQDFDSLARELCGQFRVVCPDVAGRGDSDRLDRKSTRLNSSHRCISYAVFCLKKKTTKQTT